MEQVLVSKLHDYLIQNNVDLIISLQTQNNIAQYLKEKVDSIGSLLDELLTQNTPAYVIEEICMDKLTKGLSPSRFNYVNSILEEEFETDFLTMKENGILTYEVINLLEVCKPVFENFGFTEQPQKDKHLHYAIAGTLNDHFTKQVVKK